MHATRICVSVAAALSAVALAGCQSARPAAGLGAESGQLAPQQREFAEALALYSRGLMLEMHRDFEGARDFYHQAIALDPENQELYFRVAMGMLHEQRSDEAIVLMEQLVEQRPRSTKALRWLALIYRAGDRLADSEQTYKKWIELDSENAAPYIQLASLYVRAERVEDAVRLLEDSLEQVSTPVDVLRALAEVHLELSSESDRKKVRDEHLAAAIEVNERILGMRPGDLAVLNKLGELYLQNQQVEKAITFYEQMELREPDNLRVKEKLAESFLAMGEQKKALAVLEDIAVLQPANPRVHYYLGDLYQQLGDAERAVETYRRAVKADPTAAAGYLKLAVLLMADDPGAAVDVLRDGLEKLPGDETLIKTMAHVYFVQKDYEKAADTFGDVLSMMEEREDVEVTPSFYFNYAIAAERAERLERAAELLQKAMATNIAFIDAYAQFVFRQDDEDGAGRALAVFGHLAEVIPDEPRVYYYRALLHNYLSDFDLATEAFGRTVELAGDAAEYEELINAQFYFWYAAAHERAKRFEESEELFAKCLELDPDHAEAYNYLAYMWAERGERLDEALQHVQRALELSPDSGAFVDTLGWVYYMQGKHEKALAEIERAAELIPDDPTVVEHLGDVLFKLGGVDDALPKWKRSFVLDPDNDAVATKLTDHGVDLGPLRTEAEVLTGQKDVEGAAEEGPGLEGPETDPILLPPVPEAAPDEDADMLPVPKDGPLLIAPQGR